MGAAISLRPRFLMVLTKSPVIRARPDDAIRAARLRREGRSRIGKLVEVELNRDGGIFDLEADSVSSVTFHRSHVVDNEGRRWRYRDIVAAQRAYLREQAQRESRCALDRNSERDPLAGVVDPQDDAAVMLADGGAFVGGKIIDHRGLSSGGPVDWSGVSIKHATGSPVKAVRT